MKHRGLPLVGLSPRISPEEDSTLLTGSALGLLSGRDAAVAARAERHECSLGSPTPSDWNVGVFVPHMSVTRCGARWRGKLVLGYSEGFGCLLRSAPDCMRERRCAGTNIEATAALIPEGLVSPPVASSPGAGVV
jgi:hypothetical protein